MDCCRLLLPKDAGKWTINRPRKPLNNVQKWYWRFQKLYGWPSEKLGFTQKGREHSLVQGPMFRQETNQM